MYFYAYPKSPICIRQFVVVLLSENKHFMPEPLCVVSLYIDPMSALPLTALMKKFHKACDTKMDINMNANKYCSFRLTDRETDRKGRTRK